MATISTVTGGKQVMENLNREIAKIKDSSLRGLINASAFIRQETEKGAPITPLDLGNLRSSWFVVTAQGKVGADKWNKGFRSTKIGTKKVENQRMSADYTAAVQESLGEARAKKASGQHMLIMGYSAHYAVYVHENLTIKNWSRGVKGHKWFQDAIGRNTSKIVKIIAETSQIK